MLPCTYLPPWWFNGIFIKNKKNKIKEIKLLNKYQNNMAGMTMWLSGKITKPGYAEIKHVQRVTQLRKYIVAKKKLHLI